MQPFEPPNEPELSLEELRMPSALRGAYLLVMMSFTCGLALMATVFVVAVVGVSPALFMVLVYPLLGAAMASGAIVAGSRALRQQNGRHAPLASFVMVLGALELLGWMALMALPMCLVFV